jgi:hypothetical protein
MELEQRLRTLKGWLRKDIKESGTGRLPIGITIIFIIHIAHI